jgi:hypothetical protein
MKEEILNIVSELEDIKLHCSNDIIFQKAIDIYLFRLKEQDKDRASPRQISYLESLGYEGNTSQLSSLEASKLIDELKKNEKRNND